MRQRIAQTFRQSENIKFRLRGRTWITVFWLFTLILGVGIMGRYAKTHQLNVTEVRAIYITPTPVIKNPTDEQTQIIEYIKEVFGKDSDKAFKLLSCENKSLNPNALNDNTTWGGVGKDWGVFQINDTWQKTQSKFLKNWKVNIQIAKQLFDENGGKFNLWTCGKKLNI